MAKLITNDRKYGRLRMIEYANKTFRVAGKNKVRPGNRKHTFFALTNEELSLHDMKTEADFVKRQKNVNGKMVVYFDVSSWEILKQKFPSYARDGIYECYVVMCILRIDQRNRDIATALDILPKFLKNKR